VVAVLGMVAALMLAACSSGTPSSVAPSVAATASTASPTSAPLLAPTTPAPTTAVSSTLLVGMPPPWSPTNVYLADRTMSPTAAQAKALVYVPNTTDNTVSVIDQKTMVVIRTYPVGAEPQHVEPSSDLETLYTTSDSVATGNDRPTGVDHQMSRLAAVRRDVTRALARCRHESILSTTPSASLSRCPRTG